MNELSMVTTLATSAAIDEIGRWTTWAAVLAGSIVLIVCLLSRMTKDERLPFLATSAFLFATAGVSHAVPLGMHEEECRVVSNDTRLLNGIDRVTIDGIRDACRTTGAEIAAVLPEAF